MGNTGEPDLSQNQRTHLLGRCTDINAISWSLATITAHATAPAVDTPTVVGPPHQGHGYTSSHPLPAIAGIPVFPIQHSRRSTSFHGVAPKPYPWAPKFLPEQWVYTDGSDITGHPRLDAAMVHIPSSTTIYIDDVGTEETRTIMRA